MLDIQTVIHSLRILTAIGNHFMFNPVTHGPLFNSYLMALELICLKKIGLICPRAVS
jgi:hypothetical protein